MNEKVKEVIEPEFDKMCATCGLPAVYLTEDGVCLSSREFIYRLFTEYQRTKKALELANECVAGFSETCFNCWEQADQHDENGQVDMMDEIGRMICGKPDYKAREVQKEIEKLLGGGE